MELTRNSETGTRETGGTRGTGIGGTGGTRRLWLPAPLKTAGIYMP